MLKKIKRILEEKKEQLLSFAQEFKDVEHNYKDLSPRFLFGLFLIFISFVIGWGVPLVALWYGITHSTIAIPLLPERLHTVSVGYLLQSGLRLQQKIIFIICVILPQNLSCVYTIHSTSLP